MSRRQFVLPCTPMSENADFRLVQSADAQVLVLTGDWTSAGMGNAHRRLGKALAVSPSAALDLSSVARFDTTGAYGVLQAMPRSAGDETLSASPENQRLLNIVRSARKSVIPAETRSGSWRTMFERVGRGVVGLWDAVYDTLVFNGHLLVAIGRAVARPDKIRWASVFSLAERAGLDAMPIVALTTLFIGAVVGLLGANMLSRFGAQVFAVELIGIAVLREFNVLITALLLAGRSASSFAAEIGAMKMNQEVDAMVVLGVDPFDALVFPRFLALLLTIPLLVFGATLAGLTGGGLVAWSILGLTPEAFLQRLIDNVGITQFWVGLSKAPVMAVVIAGIGCRQGLAVSGDVESLGRRVTAAVVEAIFAAILIDALFALIYMKLDL